MDIDKVFDRVKKFYKLKTDNDLAEFFEVSRNTFSSWKKRNTMNWELLFEKCVEMDYNYLLCKTQRYVHNAPSSLLKEPIQEYDSTNHNEVIELKAIIKELRTRLDECRQTIVMLSKNNIVSIGVAAATPPDE